jgi:GIY-YIG catalytic domain
VLRSQKTGRRYVGSCEDLTERLRRHNAGDSKATKHGVPWVLVHSESNPRHAVCVGFSGSERDKSLTDGSRVALLVVAAVLAAACNQDSHKPLHTLNTSIRQGVPLAEIQDARLCTLCRKIRVEFCVSRLLNGYRIYRSDPRSVFLSQLWSALDEIGKQLSARMTIGLPVVIISSILTARFYSKLLERHAPKRGLKCRSIPSLQRRRIFQQTLLIRVLIGVLLAIAEVSLCLEERFRGDRESTRHREVETILLVALPRIAQRRKSNRQAT